MAIFGAITVLPGGHFLPWPHGSPLRETPSLNLFIYFFTFLIDGSVGCFRLKLDN